MKTHTFTSEQSEQILNAVSSLKEWDGHFISYSRYLNDLFTDRLDNSIEEDDGKKEILIAPNYLIEISMYHRFLSDFFFDIESVIS